MLKFFAEKMWVAFAEQKLLTFFQRKISEYCIKSAKTVNEMTLNELVKLTTLWTTGPWCDKNFKTKLYSFLFQYENMLWLLIESTSLRHF